MIKITTMIGDYNNDFPNILLSVVRVTLLVQMQIQVGGCFKKWHNFLPLGFNSILLHLKIPKQ